jgi:hypothetical protein
MGDGMRRWRARFCVKVKKIMLRVLVPHVLSKLARTRGGVRPHWGITVIPTCGAAPAPVMPQVRPGYFHICT